MYRRNYLGGGEDVEETGSVGHGESMVKCEAVGGQ